MTDIISFKVILLINKTFYYPPEQAHQCVADIQLK